MTMMMFDLKSTRVVCHVDGLGRIKIPKFVRNELNIDKGQRVELVYNQDNTFTLRLLKQESASPESVMKKQVAGE